MKTRDGRLRNASTRSHTGTPDRSTDDLGDVILDPRRQLPSLLRTSLLVFLPAALILSLAFVQREAAIPALFRDVTISTGSPFYAGVYSQLGALLWCSAAAICIFSWAATRRVADAGEWPAFLLAGGVLSAILLIDDMFLLHDEILPLIIPRPQVATYIFYAVASVAFFLKFRRIISRTDFLILLSALAFLGLSAGIDTFGERVIGDDDDALLSYRVFFEDGSKFMGGVAWLTYFAGTCARGMNIVPGSAKG